MQQQLAKLIAALKQHYERYHADDLAALKKLYEYHAENCVRAAELTDERRRRGEYLKLAREWTEAAAALQAWTDRIMARGSNQAKQADDAASHTSLDQEDEGPLAIHIRGANARPAEVVGDL